MEESIEQVVCKSVLDAVENKDEGEVRDAHGVFEQLDERKRTLVPDDEWKTQIEERKRKLIQNVNLIQLPDGLKPTEEHKLLIVCGRLEEANNKLKFLLDEADKETIKENIPEAARVKCLDAWSKANTICLRSKILISQKKRNHCEVYHSAAKKSLTRTKPMVKLLEAIVDALRAA